MARALLSILKSQLCRSVSYLAIIFSTYSIFIGSVGSSAALNFEIATSSLSEPLIRALKSRKTIIYKTQKKFNFYRLYGHLENDRPTTFCYEFQFEEGTLKYSYKKRSAQELLEEKIWINDELYLWYDYEQHKGEVFLDGAQTLNTDLTEKNISFVKYVFSNTVLSKNKTNTIFTKFIQ